MKRIAQHLNTQPLWLQLTFVTILTLVPVALLFGLVVGAMSIAGSDSIVHYGLVSFLFSLLFIIPAAIYAYMSSKDPLWSNDIWTKARSVFSLTFLFVGTAMMIVLFLSNPATHFTELGMWAERLNVSTGEILFTRDTFAPVITVAIVALLASIAITNKRTQRSSLRAWMVVGVSLFALVSSVIIFGLTYL